MIFPDPSRWKTNHWATEPPSPEESTLLLYELESGHTYGGWMTPEAAESVRAELAGAWATGSTVVGKVAFADVSIRSASIVAVAVFHSDDD